MIYAVATHSFLIVVEFNNHWQIKNYQVLNKGYHYGIAIHDVDGTLQGRRLIAYRGGADVSAQDECQLMIYRTDKSFELVDSMPLIGKFGDVHQLAYANNGLYIVNSKYNSLVFRNLRNDIQHEYFLENVTYDRNHINSVYPCGNHILVMLHNKARQESQVAVFNHDISKGLRLERVLSLWHFACHNIYFDKNYLLYNASPVHSLIKADIESEKIVKRLAFKGHSKGLSVTSDYIVVGLSEDTFRDRRAVSKGQLAIIDRHTFSIVSVVDLNFPTLPHPIGNVNEVRCLSNNEMAHTRSSPDFDWNDFRLAEAKPFQHWLRRMKFKLLLPARRVKTKIRKYI